MGKDSGRELEWVAIAVEVSDAWIRDSGIRHGLGA